MIKKRPKRANHHHQEHNCNYITKKKQKKVFFSIEYILRSLIIWFDSLVGVVVIIVLILY